MTITALRRLELLHLLQENSEALTTHDAFSLLAGRLPDDAAVTAAWEQLAEALITATSHDS